MNRFGVQTGSSGTLHFRCTTLLADPRKRYVQSEAAEVAVLPQERRTVEDILYKFKNTMLMSRSMNASGGSIMSVSGSKQSFGARLAGASSGADSPARFETMTIISCLKNNNNLPYIFVILSFFCLFRAQDSLAEVLARARAKTAGKIGTTSSASSSPSVSSIAKEMKQSLSPLNSEFASSSELGGTATRSRSHSRDRRPTSGVGAGSGTSNARLGSHSPVHSVTSDNEESPLMSSTNTYHDDDNNTNTHTSTVLSEGIGARKKPVTPASSRTSSSAGAAESELPPLRTGTSAGPSIGIRNALGGANSRAVTSGGGSGGGSAGPSPRSGGSGRIGAAGLDRLEQPALRNRYDNANMNDDDNDEDEQLSTEQHSLLKQQ